MPTTKSAAESRGFCGRYSVVGIVSGGYRYARLRCKSWRCSYCGPRRARRLKKAIEAQAKVHGLDRSLTLTMDPRNGTAQESFSQIMGAWKKFQIYLAREFGKGIKFIWVIEAQKSGYAHLHILLDRFIPHSWIKKNWGSLGGGRIVHINRTDNVCRSAAYLAKHLAQGHNGLKVGQRRFGSSRSIKFGDLAKKIRGLWKLIKTPLEQLYEGVKATLLGEHKDPDGLLEAFETKLWPPFIPIPPG